MAEIPTLYDWVGGNDKLEKLTALFYQKVLNDSILFGVFKNMSGDHARHVAHFIGEVFGGPKIYTQTDSGSHHKMISHHFGKHLTEKMRKQWLALLLESCDELEIANDPEFRSALVAYLEWGSRLAVMNSNAPNISINDDEPMPKWGWGETGGPYNPGS